MHDHALQFRMDLAKCSRRNLSVGKPSTSSARLENMGPVYKKKEGNEGWARTGPFSYIARQVEGTQHSAALAMESFFWNSQSDIYFMFKSKAAVQSIQQADNNKGGKLTEALLGNPS